MEASSSRTSGDRDPPNRISQVARTHPLFPALQHIAQNLRQTLKAIDAIDARTRKMEHDYATITQSLQDLIAAIKRQEKKAFTIKNAGFEVRSMHILYMKFNAYIHGYIHDV